MLDFCSHRCTLLAAFLVCLTFFVSFWLIQWPSLLNGLHCKMKMTSRIETEVINMNINAKNTTVLVWYWPFGKKSSVDDNVCWERFGIPNCKLVDDRSMFSQADFVVFHNRELIQGQQRLPVDQTRPQRQKWVWFSLESPAHNGNVKPFDGHFNCTMSYRLDADVYTPYGSMVPQDFGTGLTVEDFIPKNKSSMACWVVSNYAAHHKRTAVYNRLKTIIPVNVYGGAVNKRLDGNVLLPTISRCYFYLSFENSIFKDYITEKLWYNGFMGGAVPVVLGPPREQYEAVAPKDSFIHVDDFPSLEELGKFLKSLAEDKERYASYFNWKLNYTVKRFGDWREEFCKICPKVSSLQKHKVYEDFHNWEWQ
ncbi:alpha-(1,3)-fucosyltransferase 7-like [Alosa sapidissima]|uniref:alpha-(1,3)-fucosyltransferase 7-like n=1 Tax=Alosa sapidissima TaxID=34773 RepID=UPI001C093235|nr:alpha-(1,3)-fucosyltransferase 7-like [Alosa sapidissima]